MTTETQTPAVAEQDGSGRTQRFREMVTAQLGSLYRMARHLSRNRADAEDLVQETFMNAWQGFDTFRPGTNARAWLSRILRNAHFKRYRRGKLREPETVDAEGIDEWYLYAHVHDAEFKQEAGEPETAFFSALPSDEVASAIQTLHPQFREVFVLSDLEGFSYREISEIVGVPEGTVMSRLYRARHELQRALWDYCVRIGRCRAPAVAPPRAPQPPECREACRQIYGYLDKALDTAALAAIDQHLSRCRMCCDRFKFQQRLAATIREREGSGKVPERVQARLRMIVERF